MILTNRILSLLLTLFLILEVSVTHISAQCNFSQGPVGELCSSAIYICGSDLDGFKGVLPKKLSAQQTWTGLCNGNGTADNIIWFSFTPCSPTVTLEIIPSSCTVENVIYSGVQAGLFSSCNRNASVACSDFSNNNGQTASFTLSYNNFVPGQIAYLFLDGYSGSVCNFEINVLAGIDTQPVTSPDPALLTEGAITGPNALSCYDMNQPIQYNLTAPECKINYNSSCSVSNNFNPADSVCYVWQVSPLVGRYFENQDSTGKTKNIIFTKPGTYTISADPYLHPFYGGSCANAACADVISWTVTVAPKDTTVNPIELMCPGDIRNFCGMVISTDSIVYCNSDPCNTIKQEYKVGTSKLNIMGTQYICDGGSFNFQGVSYNLSGDYDIIDKSDCALVHKFKVEIVSVKASVSTPATLLNCLTPSIVMIGQGIASGPNVVRMSWKDSSGGLISGNDKLIVNKAGRYGFSAEYVANGSICSDEVWVDITADFKKPEVTATIPTVKCKTPKDPFPMLSLATSDVLSSVEWTLPLGTKVKALSVALDSLNASTNQPYLFSAIGSNGCRLDTSFNVKTNFQRAFITLTGDNLSCYHPKDTLIISTDIPIDSIRWSKTAPNLVFYGSDPTKRLHEVIDGGTYRVEVMASSSKCWNDESINIANNINYPSVILDSGQKWYCDTKQIDIVPNVSSGSNLTYQWSTPDGLLITSGNNRNLTIGGPGEYLLNVFNTENGCGSAGKVEVLKETNVPNRLDIETSDVLCFGQDNGFLNIIRTLGGFEPYTYYLNGKEYKDITNDQLKPGSYQLEVRDKHGCSHTIDFNINEPSALQVTTIDDITVFFSDVTTLNFESNYSDAEIVDVKWYNGKGELIGNEFSLDYSSKVTDIITVEITTEAGCQARSDIKINIDSDLKLYFPNIFSPNGDGINDRFEIFKNKVPLDLNKIAIYDRFGNLIYKLENVDFEDNIIAWDGMFNGKYVIPGVYILIIDLTDFNGVNQIIKKDITVVR